MPVLGCALVFGACSLKDPPGGEGRMSIATGGSGGVYQVYGGGVAEMFSAQRPSDRPPRRPAPPSTTCSSSPTVTPRSRSALADTAIDAVEGQDSFEGEQMPLRALGTLYSNFTHVVALKSSGHQRIEDLKGKTVSIGAPNSGTEVIGLRLMAVAGLDPDKDVTRRAIGVGESSRRAARGLDRRVRLVRRPAHGRDHRPRDHRRDRPAAARLVPAQAQRALRRGLRRGRGGGGRVPGRRRRSRRSASRTC